MTVNLEVGMYVRTKNGLIAKYIGYRTDEDIEYNKYLFDGKIYWYYEYYNDYVYEEDFKEWLDEEVIKTSFDKIDLVKCGDYVNGYKITEIIEKPRKCLKTEYKINLSYVYFCFYEKDIKSIVTKEQFSSMEYRLGDDK